MLTCKGEEIWRGRMTEFRMQHAMNTEHNNLWGGGVIVRGLLKISRWGLKAVWGEGGDMEGGRWGGGGRG